MLFTTLTPAWSPGLFIGGMTRNIETKTPAEGRGFIVSIDDLINRGLDRDAS